MNLIEAKRPVLVLGAGVHRAGAQRDACDFAALLQIPVCLTWGAADVIQEGQLRIGTFGTHGTRAANFAVQNADFLLCIGTRLDTKATGTPAKWFAREAHIVMVDIDQAEIDKMAKVGVKVEGVCMDAKKYVAQMIHYAKNYPVGIARIYWADWLDRCHDWKVRYPAVLPEYEQEKGVNPYVLIRELSRLAQPGDVIVSDTGCALAWCMQAWEFKEDQRFLHPMNQTPMGYGLPAAIGAHYATGKRVICVTGDGSIMMSIGELATIAGHNLPIKIVLLDNKGHAMCRQTQREWMGATYPSTSIEGGLRFPDFDAACNGFGIPSMGSLKHMLEWPEAAMYRADIAPDADVVPKAKFGAPNEDQYPHLPSDVLAKEMIVPLAA